MSGDVVEGLEQVAKAKGSYTGAYLKPLLERGKVAAERVAAE